MSALYSASAILAGKKLAFLSVFDKHGLEAFARALCEQYGYTLLSTGGTRQFLQEHDIPAVETSEITGFDELLGGRVKSLHPEIFAGILAQAADREQKAAPFFIDTVVVNLYPFEAERDAQQLKKHEGNKGTTVHQEKDIEHLLHFIDIGGSSLLRAAAKNHPVVNVLGSPAQYEAFLAELEKGQGKTTLGFRQQLAAAAFAQSAHYDALIAQNLVEQTQESPAVLPEIVSLPLSKITDLRYGENPHQNAALYGLGVRKADFEALHGKELSFNNILDMQAAWAIATEFVEHPACVIVKHNNPCGVALSKENQAEAFLRALDTDPLSAFGGVVAFNQPVNVDTAKRMKDIFLEVIIAPDFDKAAFDLLSTKKNLRLVRRQLPIPEAPKPEYKQVSSNLFLVQCVDESKQQKGMDTFKVATELKPTDAQLEDMVFSWKVVKHVKSNAMVLAKGGRTVGIGGGQTSRIGALEGALKLACDEAHDAVLASDGFLPHEDNVHAAAQARVGAIIQPGGSIKDSDVIKLANDYKLSMVTTGIREFRH
jgi:phosphoribosylaminoimidazolecarboxamide formyltransferase/IMP cyclohydrolase